MSFITETSEAFCGGGTELSSCLLASGALLALAALLGPGVAQWLAPIETSQDRPLSDIVINRIDIERV